MNKLLFCGLVLLSFTATPQHENPLLEDVYQEAVQRIDPLTTNEHLLVTESMDAYQTSDPCTPGIAENGTWFDVEYLEMDEIIDLGFDTASFLPDSFDPYAAPFDLAGINYIEEEAGLDPVFDTSLYLPEGFDPYEMYVDWEDIVYLEEEDLDLGFDTSKYLPAGFDPYAVAVQ